MGKHVVLTLMSVVTDKEQEVLLLTAKARSMQLTHSFPKMWKCFVYEHVCSQLFLSLY